jgi:hypothetical protein
MKKENKHSNFKLTKNLKNNEAFKVPVGYFNTVEDGVFAQVKAEKLHVNSSKNAFKTPKNYFNSVEDIVIAKLKAEVLNKTKTDNQIPDEYFNSIEGSILSKIKSENKSKVIPLKSRILKYMVPIAIAASFLLIIVLNNNSKTLSFDSLASDDIVNYFENDNAAFDPLTVASLYTESELDNETISAAITNDEVVDYLSEEDLEQITYEN